MSPKLEDIKYHSTVPTKEHIVTYNLKLSFRTYENDGETLLQELENKQEEFDAMTPEKQIEFLLQLGSDLSEGEFEYEAIQSVDIGRMLKSIYKVQNDQTKEG